MDSAGASYWVYHDREQPDEWPTVELPFGKIERAEPLERVRPANDVAFYALSV